ncbi:lasso peptide biosynthesis PqqD family chaperone [Peribacillus psychrosaccharolyticus]|uniref:lasso peptide biosynthesis PqqD family chaperone n=1 Tax=Peribacillus psychrosaccharolyticus TaxID=1407 RepID=UPI003D2A8A22
MTQTISTNQVISQAAGYIVSDMDGEKVMLSIQSGKYYNLGLVGGDIWDLIKEPVSIEHIVQSLQSIYDVSQIECEEQVRSFLEKLKEEGLILIS